MSFTIKHSQWYSGLRITAIKRLVSLMHKHKDPISTLASFFFNIYFIFGYIRIFTVACELLSSYGTQA